VEPWGGMSRKFGILATGAPDPLIESAMFFASPTGRGLDAR